MRKAKRQNLYRTPIAFELPESLRGPGKAIAQAHGLAVFAANCMRGTILEGSALIICLDGNAAVTKEYRHLPAKEADLRRFAGLEAETVLKDSPDNYYIATQEYNHTERSSGRLKSVLFAVQKQLVANVAQEFRQAGIRVLKICPMLSGLMNSCRTMLGLTPGNPAWKGKTVAVVDTGYENLRVILFTNGEPVFQKEFDSVWSDILDTLHRDGGCSYDEALREMKRPGFLLSGGNASFGESVTSLVNTLLETASAEVLRNMRVVLSAERLEPEQIIFCGALASHPDFNRYFDGMSLDIPYVGAEAASKRYQTAVGVLAQAGVQGSRSGDFFTLNGMTAPHGAIDFLEQEKDRLGSRRISRATIVLLCVAAAAVMAVEPIVYNHALAQEQADKTALSASRITEARNLQAEKGRLEDQLRVIRNDGKLLPWQKSKMEEAVGNLWTQFAPKVTSVSSCQISGETGLLEVSFTAASVDQFNVARQSVVDSGYFDVLAPFSISKGGAAGAYQCSVTLKIRNFQPAASVSAAPAPASAASGSSQGGKSS